MKSVSFALILIALVAACSASKERATDATPREKIEVGDTVFLASGVKYVFAKMAKEGDFVTRERLVTTHINLIVGDKTVWTTYEPLQPFAFVLNQQPMIAGFDEVIMYMRAGDRLMAIIPSHLGYGERGAGADIPPNSTLHFDIEVLSVE